MDLATTPQVSHCQHCGHPINQTIEFDSELPDVPGPYRLEEEATATGGKTYTAVTVKIRVPIGPVGVPRASAIVRALNTAFNDGMKVRVDRLMREAARRLPPIRPRPESCADPECGCDLCQPMAKTDIDPAIERDRQPPRVFIGNELQNRPVRADQLREAGAA